MSTQKHIIRLAFKKQCYIDHIRFDPLVKQMGRVVFIIIDDNNFTLADNTLQFFINETGYAYTTDRFQYIAKGKIMLYGKEKEKKSKKWKRKIKVLRNLIQ